MHFTGSIIEHVSDYTIRGHPFMTSTQKERGGGGGGGGGGRGWGGGGGGWKRGRFNIWTDADV